MLTIRRKCFISYYSSDWPHVKKFIDEYSNIFIPKVVNSDYDNVIKSSDRDYTMKKIRESYLSDSTVTIVMIGKCTWARKYIDWEIASTLRNDPINKRSGLVAITLPYMDNQSKTLPPRLKDNFDSGYAHWYKYPSSSYGLRKIIEEAYKLRDNASLVRNSRELFGYNRSCA